MMLSYLDGIFNNEPSFVSDVFVKLDTPERIANQSTFHAHHRHAKMEARADNPATIHTNVNAHQVNEYTFLTITFVYVWNLFKKLLIENVAWRKTIIKNWKSIEAKTERSAHSTKFGSWIKNKSG